MSKLKTILMLNTVEKETKRFLLRLDAAKKRIIDSEYHGVGTKETGALKRAALDLKNELTKITQNLYNQ